MPNGSNLNRLHLYVLVFNQSMLSPDTIYGVTITTVIGLCLNHIAQCLSTTKKCSKHPLFLKFTGTTQPVWCWALSACLSGFVYSSLYATAMYKTGSNGRSSWLYGSDTRTLSSPDTDLQYFRYFFYVFFAYLVRDLPLSTNPMFFAHHFACVAGILSTLETTSPGAISATHGIIILELGSFSFNIWGIDDVMRHHPKHFPWWPQWEGPWITYHYYIMLSLSNVVSGYFLYMSVTASFNSGHAVFGWWSMLAGFPLLLLRENEVYKTVRGINKKPTMLKEDLDALKEQ